MYRDSYFREISSYSSPLLLLQDEFPALLKARAEQDESYLDVYLQFADKLEKSPWDAAKTRAAFIKLQCKGTDTEDLFNEYSESWGIPKFEDELVAYRDFRNGFLWTFRDHSTSWNEDEEARTWFYNHPEGRFARRYEYYSGDTGPEELLLIESGEYKHILRCIVKKHEDFSPLISPVFSKSELEDFYAEHDPSLYGSTSKDILQIIQQNPNWKL
jgi:hypothetical protein